VKGMRTGVVTGVTLLRSAFSAQPIPRDLVKIASGQAWVLGGVSLIYSLKGRISKIYLLDSATEFALAGAWRRG
jgi:hypothetical protein